MTSTFHYLQFAAFAHATEDLEKVKQVLRRASGEEKLAISEERMEGGHHNLIVRLEGSVKSAAKINAFFKRLTAQAGVADALRSQLDRRLGDDLVFYLRLAKQDCLSGELKLASDEDAVQVRAKIAAFPAKSPVARELMETYLSQL